MNIRKIVFYTLAFLSLSVFYDCAPSMVYTTNWQSKPVVIDGQTNDWELPLRFFDPDTKLSYSITNDAENLYICVRATDDDNVKGITRRGLQLWIDTTGKKRKQVGILFPMMLPGQGAREGGENHHANNGANGYEQGSSATEPGMIDTAKENRIHRNFVESAKQMHVSGFKTIPDGIVALPNVYGLNLAVSWNKDNVLVYEAAIPFKTFLQNPNADPTKVFGIAFSFSITPQRTSGGGGGGMHGGGMHGGGMGGGMGGGGGGMRGGGGGGGGGSSEPETHTLWAAFRLSTGK